MGVFNLIIIIRNDIIHIMRLALPTSLKKFKHSWDIFMLCGLGPAMCIFLIFLMYLQ